MEKRLIVDMDGVLADVYEQFIRYELEETGRKISLGETLGLSESEAFLNGRKHVRLKGFFRNAPVIPSAVEVLERLNQKYEVFIVSSATEFPNSLEEKYYWMEEHFPFVSWQQLVFCGSKAIVKGDFMIDDHFKNLDRFEGKTFLFTQPHNVGHSERSHHRVNSWIDIAGILL
ncbi:MAG TPA: 5'(3')-deoxyribonucleotidase [Cyclobacteriaceae bacterium]|nr:5'(3')-deoxyribonucleotidase [Cyclobacteriaceae bacterium]